MSETTAPKKAVPRFNHVGLSVPAVKNIQPKQTTRARIRSALGCQARWEQIGTHNFLDLLHYQPS